MALLGPFTVNVSSPNTPGLRSLQFWRLAKKLVGYAASTPEKLTILHGKRVPLAIKIAPDMSDEEITNVAYILIETGMDAVIATRLLFLEKVLKGCCHLTMRRAVYRVRSCASKAPCGASVS